MRMARWVEKSMPANDDLFSGMASAAGLPASSDAVPTPEGSGARLAGVTLVSSAGGGDWVPSSVAVCSPLSPASP
jgi:hypothetical protein